jgi:DNA repair photolyase
MAIKKFVDAGVSCGVNIDPILPLITDSQEEIELILESCISAGVKHVFGAILRLRDDIWQRMTTILKSLDMKIGIDEYRRIYQFSEPLKTGFNIAANQLYSDTVMHSLEQNVSKRGMFNHFPDHVKSRRIAREFANNTNGASSGQLTLSRYM